MARGNNEGSLYRRKDGRWVAQITLHNGKRKARYAKTRQEAARKLSDLLRIKQEGMPIPSDRMNVGSFLEEWIKTTKSKVRHSTWRRYEQLTRTHAIPQIGHLTLARLEPRHLESLYADRLEYGLSNSTVRQLHAILRRAFSQAQKWGAVHRNVVALATPPKIQRKETSPLNRKQTELLLDSAKGEKLEALFVLAVTTGMRQGELLGLKWSDVNLKQGFIQVQHTLQKTEKGKLELCETKTAKSRRRVSLAKIAVFALEKHLHAQKEEKLKVGGAWEDRDLVFVNEVGSPLDGTCYVRRLFKRLLKEAKLPNVRFHDLRHTAASLLLESGVHPKVVSEMLGHATVSITMDIYSHILPNMQREAADAMDAALGKNCSGLLSNELSNTETEDCGSVIKFPKPQ